ncbi:hypothetical protein B296_00023336 [Ensete ventricosum]|uniref:Uncharacterized protein n=1 Tax=Ensete ventricosum TaxID=4639 RepID=A0A426YBN2_ENSVE|nr:hypothetical protein B296_00023336 [Ensete ventricosum]
MRRDEHGENRVMAEEDMGLTSPATLALGEAVADEPLVAAAPEPFLGATPGVDRNVHALAGGVGRAKALPVEPPPDLRGPEYERRLVGGSVLPVPHRGVQEPAVSGGCREVDVGYEPVRPPAGVTADVVVLRPAVGQVHPLGDDVGGDATLGSGFGRAVAKEKRVARRHGVVGPEEPGGAADGAVAERRDVQVHGVRCDAPDAKLAEESRAVAGAGKTDRTSGGEAKGVGDGRAGAAGPVAPSSACSDTQQRKRKGEKQSMGLMRRVVVHHGASEEGITQRRRAFMRR